MRNTVRKQREGLRGGGEAPPPRVARTGLGAGLGRAGRAPEGACLGRAERARMGRTWRGGASAGGAGPGVRPALAEVVEEGGGESARSGG